MYNLWMYCCLHSMWCRWFYIHNPVFLSPSFKDSHTQICLSLCNLLFFFMVQLPRTVLKLKCGRSTSLWRRLVLKRTRSLMFLFRHSGFLTYSGHCPPKKKLARPTNDAPALLFFAVKDDWVLFCRERRWCSCNTFCRDLKYSVKS